MPTPTRPIRRNDPKLAAAACALPLMHIRTAGAAGRVNSGLRDHRVPDTNDLMQQQVEAWIRPWHDQQPSSTSAAASPDVAVQIYRRAMHSQMMARLTQDQKTPQSLPWAQDEIAGFVR